MGDRARERDAYGQFSLLSPATARSQLAPGTPENVPPGSLQPHAWLRDHDSAHQSINNPHQHPPEVQHQQQVQHQAPSPHHLHYQNQQYQQQQHQQHQHQQYQHQQYQHQQYQHQVQYNQQQPYLDHEQHPSFASSTAQYALVPPSLREERVSPRTVMTSHLPNAYPVYSESLLAARQSEETLNKSKKSSVSSTSTSSLPRFLPKRIRISDFDSDRGRDGGPAHAQGLNTQGPSQFSLSPLVMENTLAPIHSWPNMKQSSQSQYQPSVRQVVVPSPTIDSFSSRRSSSNSYREVCQAPSAASSSASSPTSQSSYRFICRQQPIHARMCGFGEKDRRPLDPPPILEVHVTDTNGKLDKEAMRDPFFVVHTTLWNEDGTQDRNLIASNAGARNSAVDGNNQSDVSASTKITRVLMGSLVASPSILADESGVEACYFVFPDLSVRTEGKYRLRFTLMRLGLDSLSSGGGTKTLVLAECQSDVFVVYSAKKFPGMLKSSELTKAFAKQGLKLQIRNDVRAKKGNEDSSTRYSQTNACDIPTYRADDQELGVAHSKLTK